MDAIVRLPHLWSGDSQGQETFLAPSADKQTHNYDIECHHTPLSTLRSKGLSCSKRKWWAYMSGFFISPCIGNRTSVTILYFRSIHYFQYLAAVMFRTLECKKLLHRNAIFITFYKSPHAEVIVHFLKHNVHQKTCSINRKYCICWMHIWSFNQKICNKTANLSQNTKLKKVFYSKLYNTPIKI